MSSAAPSSSPPPLLEVCCDSVSSCRAAVWSGAARVELCSGLVDGGLTPSSGLIRAVVRCAADEVAVSGRATAVGVHVLIRPRPGDFLYTADEMEVILADIAEAKSLGADGVVLGMLRPDGQIDVKRTRLCMERAAPMQVTFHRAFDLSRDLLESARVLMDLGVKRVLTSGGCKDAIEGRDTIKSLVALCGDRMVILAGGGLTAANIPEFVAHTGVREVHASLRGDWVFGGMTFRKECVYMGGEKRNDGPHIEYATKEASQDLICTVTRQPDLSRPSQRDAAAVL